MKFLIGLVLLLTATSCEVRADIDDTAGSRTRWMLVEGHDGPRVVRYHKGIWKHALLREEAKPDGSRRFNWATQEGPGDYRIHSSVPAEMGFALTGQKAEHQNPPAEMFVVKEKQAEY